MHDESNYDKQKAVAGVLGLIDWFYFTTVSGEYECQPTTSYYRIDQFSGKIESRMGGKWSQTDPSLEDLWGTKDLSRYAEATYAIL